MSDVSDDEQESVRDQTPPPVSRKSAAHLASHSKRSLAHSPDGGSVNGGHDTPAPSGKKGPNNALFNGPKVKHLKKADGIPLWRKDIQYTFLDLIFRNDKKVFTNIYDKSTGHTFCEIYLTAMARSSKTSRILREKLIALEENSRAMAMVCLLVNLGRINTTLNFFLEMKAQLRTYHAIPSLQARGDSDPHAYKQLQDAPRLKSILKGACEDEVQPTSLEDLRSKDVPRTNPICAVFLLAQFSSKVTDLHFNEVDFFDLVMRPNLGAASRANAFLWLMWYYLESDFSDKACKENPFGPGIISEKGLHWVPEFTHLTEEEEKLEDVDTPEEKAFGEKMQKERKKYIEDGSIGAPGTNKRGKKARELADEDGSRVGSPASVAATPHEKANGKRGVRASGRTGRKSYGPDHYESDAATRSPSPDHRGRKHPLNGIDSDGSPAPAKRRMKGPSGARIILSHGKRSQTSHQVALAENRRERTNHLVDKLIRERHRRFKKIRLAEGNLERAAKRLAILDALYDTEDEDMTMDDYKKEREKCTFDFDANGKLFFKDELSKKEASKQRGDKTESKAEGRNGIKSDPDGDEGSDIDMDDVPDAEDAADANGTDSDDDRPLAAGRDLSSPTLARRPANPDPALNGSGTPHPLSMTYVPGAEKRVIYGNGSYYHGPAGLMPLADEPDDVGEELTARAAAFRRAYRRYDRWVNEVGSGRKKSTDVVLREEAQEYEDGEAEEDAEGEMEADGDAEAEMDGSESEEDPDVTITV